MRCTASIAQAAPATCRPRPLTARSVRCLPLRRQLRGSWNGGRPCAHRTDASSTACWPRANMRSGWCHRPGRVGLLAAGAFCDIIESSAQPAVGCPRGPSDGHDTQQAEHVFQPAPADRPLALPRTAPATADVSRRRRPRPPSIQRIRLYLTGTTRLAPGSSCFSRVRERRAPTLRAAGSRRQRVPLSPDGPWTPWTVLLHSMLPTPYAVSVHRFRALRGRPERGRMVT